MRKTLEATGARSALLIAMLSSACAAQTPMGDPGDMGALEDAFEEDVCAELDCDAGKADGLLSSLRDRFFANDGDLSALSERSEGAGERYAGRIAEGFTVVDEEGAALTGLSGLARCVRAPDSCRVNLYTRLEIHDTTAEEVVDLLYGDWRYWWRHSDIEGEIEVLDEGASGYSPIRFTFYPLESLRSAVVLDMTVGEPERNVPNEMPEVDAPGATPIDVWDYRVPVHFGGGAWEGDMSLLVAERDGVVHFRELWHGIRITGALRRFPSVAGVAHLWAGGSSFPSFLRGEDAFGLEGETGWVGLMDALEAERHPSLGQLPYRDRIHETPGDEHVVVRGTVDDPGAIDDGEERYLIFGSSTVERIDASPEEVVEALRGHWGLWWRHGRQCDRSEDAYGNIRYHLEPLLVGGVGLASVDEVMGPPEETVIDGQRAYRIPIRLEGPDFVGPAHFEVVARDDGGSRVVGRFDGVRPHRIWGASRVLARAAMRNHVMAQEGTMPASLRGSGLVGLVSLLERGEALEPEPCD